jgi:transposase
MAEKPDITMPELASELAAIGLRIDPASLSRWYRRNGYRYKKNTAGIGTRSSRRGGSTARMDRQAPATDAA